MIYFTFEDIENNYGLESKINIQKYDSTDLKLRSIFNRYFNEHDYKQNKINKYEKFCKNNNYQLITDFNINDIVIDKNKNIYNFVIFDYKKLNSLINSVKLITGKSYENIIVYSNFYIICDIEEIFDNLYINNLIIEEMSITLYELFNRKIMLKCSIQTKNFNYNITKQQLATLEIYNYIYNHAYELLQKLLSYCHVTKVFDVITAQQTPEAKELNTLINTFKQNY